MPELDAQLLALRPPLLLSEADSPMANFQNQTLRPILKLLHPRFIYLAQDYLQRQGVQWENFSSEKQRSYLDTMLRQQTDFKFLLIGLVSGHFTQAELVFFCAHRNEIVRRMVAFLSKRLYEGLLLTYGKS
ncbi:MAG: hypothetical protein HC913_11665 [Microscillaceae bacterium]|nr:hypothetical protein [Microscillaceae bacterium]